MITTFENKNYLTVISFTFFGETYEAAGRSASKAESREKALIHVRQLMAMANSVLVCLIDDLAA